MIHAADINPDVELRDFLQGRVVVGKTGGGTEPVTVYGDWERPTNKLPDDFISLYINGNVDGIGSGIDYAEGYLVVSLYCKLNNDGSAKKNRVKNILRQFDTLLKKVKTEHFIYKFEMNPFLAPTTPNQTSGYSTTSLNLFWHTTNNFNSQ